MSQSESPERDEVAQFCSKCGQPKGPFDVFCGQCSKPLMRRFPIVLPGEILLFVGAGVMLSLAHHEVVPGIFRYVPLVFLVQCVVLYLLRLALRQRRFILLIGVYIAFVGIGIAGFSIPAFFVAIAPLFLGVGVIVLWSLRLRNGDVWGSMQTLWVALLITGLGLAVFTGSDSVLRAHFPSRNFLEVLAQFLNRHTAWFSLGGFVLTLATRSGVRVARQGVFVKKDYYPNARISLSPLDVPAKTAFPVVALTVLLHASKVLAYSLYNSLIAALNLVVRSLVFTWRVVQYFVIALVQEVPLGVKRLGSFAGLCVVRVLIPLCAIYLAASATIASSSLFEMHVFAPTWGTTLAIAWAGAHLLVFTFATVACFASVPVGKFAESYVRDFSILLGYGMPLLLLCSLSLWLASLGSRSLFQLDLGFRVRHFSFISLAVLVAGAIFLGRSHLKALALRWQGRQHRSET